MKKIKKISLWFFYSQKSGGRKKAAVKTFAVTGILLFFLSVTAFGQRTIRINAKDIVPLSLSDIATAVHHIDLEPAGFQYISKVIYADPYLFVSVYSVVNEEKTPVRVLQYGLNGKLIRETVKNETTGNVCNMMCDIPQKRLFVTFGRETKCFDFSGKLLDTIPVKPSAEFYHNGRFYMMSVERKNDVIHYFLLNCDLNTAAKNNILADLKETASPGNEAFRVCQSVFSVYGNSVHVAVIGLDNTIYRIQGQKLNPVIQFTAVPSGSIPVDKYGYKFQGFIGNCLFINYMINMQPYVYVEDLSNKLTYNVKIDRAAKKGIVDDIFGTGVCDISPLNVENHFYFVKKTNENFTVYIAGTK